MLEVPGNEGEVVEDVVRVGVVLVGVAWLGGGSGPVAKCEEEEGGGGGALVVVVGGASEEG